MRVLRLCSVFGVPDRPVPPEDLRFDAVGGMQNHTGHLVQALDRLGVRQRVVTSWPPSQPREELLGAGAEVHRFGWPVTALRQGWAAQAAAALPRLSAGVDLVHAHLGEDLAVLPMARAAARARGVPLVVTVHLSLRHTLPGRGPRAALMRGLGGVLELGAVREAAAVLVLTERAARAALADGAAPARVHVLPSGVDPDLFAPPAAPGPDPLAPDDPAPGPPRPRVLFVGRLGEQKGLPALVRAAALMREDADVVLAGEGPQRPLLEALVAQLGAGRRVRLTGYLDHRLVPAALRTAAVAVQPSRYEEMGTSVVEAMATGLPVVATRTGGIPSLVRDGETGRLVPVDDAPALAAALDELLADPVRAAAMGARARRAVAGHAWPSLAAGVLRVYRDAVTPGGDQRRATPAPPTGAA
ncbi:starch synthase [Quadrisphaera sp. DSM 44207]|nr:starch synthase [Quadrisphaera sp. DSM 44207]